MFEGDITITVSAGVAEYVPGESVAETLRRADEALYVAKQSGRNRVASAVQPETEAPVPRKKKKKTAKSDADADKVIVRGNFSRGA